MAPVLRGGCRRGARGTSRSTRSSSGPGEARPSRLLGHLADGVLLEPLVPQEPAEDPPSDGYLESLHLFPAEARGFVEPDAGGERVLPLFFLAQFENEPNALRGPTFRS